MIRRALFEGGSSPPVLQFGGDGAERRAEIGADQGEGGDGRDRDQCGNQRIFDRRDPGLVFDQIHKKSAQRNSPWFNKGNRAQDATEALNNRKRKMLFTSMSYDGASDDFEKSPIQPIILGSRQEKRANPARVKYTA